MGFQPHHVLSCRCFPRSKGQSKSGSQLLHKACPDSDAQEDHTPARSGLWFHNLRLTRRCCSFSSVQRAAGPGLVSAFGTKHPAWHRKGSDVSLQVSCHCKCANDPEQPWLTLPCQTRAGGAMSHGCCLVNGTGCHGLLEHFKCPLGTWKLLGNGSLPPSSLPFFSTQSYRNSSTRETGSHSLTLFYEKSLVYFCNFLKVQGTSTVSDLNYYPSQVTLITTCPPGHEGLWI